ncbi:hypothetical protein Glove_55g58 [Diversispora epigaea]|uniref:Transposase n=1 Tax=Diversispora epigaea TaxID=1348612 RepID=A0A397JJ78_9GLOM|nr:hypothetical protein Glove_55g58 [Diversispora epigaea]
MIPPPPPLPSKRIIYAQEYPVKNSISNDKKKSYSTLNAKDCKPYWNDRVKVLSERLWLPTMIDYAGLPMNSLSTCSYSTLKNSWFSSTIRQPTNVNCPNIYLPSTLPSSADCRRFLIVRVDENKNKYKEMINFPKIQFLRTVAYLKLRSKKVYNDIPNHIIDETVDEAIKNFNSKKVYNDIPNHIIDETVDEAIKNFNSKLIYFRKTNEWIFLWVHENQKELKETHERFVAIDPGVRTPFVMYSPTKGITEVGKNDAQRLFRLCLHADKLSSTRDKLKSSISKRKKKQAKRIDKAISRIFRRIKNLRNELHKKTINHLVKNYDVVIIPEFNVSNMVRRETRKINSKTLIYFRKTNEWIFLWVHENQKELKETHERFVAIDPGVRTPFVMYSPTKGITEVGKNDAQRLFRLCLHADKLSSTRDKLKSSISKRKKKQAKRIDKAISRIFRRIKNLRNELHKKTINHLVKNYDVVIIPEFNVSNMVRRETRKINSKTVKRMLTWSHYSFRQRLKHKAEEIGMKMIIQNEAYASKTCSACGNIQNIGGRKVQGMIRIHSPIENTNKYDRKQDNFIELCFTKDLAIAWQDNDINNNNVKDTKNYIDSEQNRKSRKDYS